MKRQVKLAILCAVGLISADLLLVIAFGAVGMGLGLLLVCAGTWFIVAPVCEGFMPFTSPNQAVDGTGKRLPWKREDHR